MHIDSQFSLIDAPPQRFPREEDEIATYIPSPISCFFEAPIHESIGNTQTTSELKVQNVFITGSGD